MEISPRKRRGSEGDLSPSTSTPESRGEVEKIEKPRSESSLLRIRAQIKAASALELDKSVRTMEEPLELGEGNDSFFSERSAVGGGALHEMPRLANVLLQKTKTKLEESRNLSREIREFVVSGMHGLHEMILRLADSRNRHIADKEKQRASYERRLLQLESKHSADLRSLVASHQDSYGNILEKIKASHKEIEATRWLSLDIEKLIQANARAVTNLADKQVLLAGGTSGQEINTIQQDIAMLRLELGTLNEAAFVGAQRSSEGADASTTAALRDIKEGFESLRKEVVSGARATNGSQRPLGSQERSGGTSSNQYSSQGPRKSYARVLATPKHGVMLESIEPQHTSDDVLKLVKDSVDVIQMGIGINKVAKISKQRVIINCDTERDRDALQKAIKEKNSKITVSNTRNRKPLLRLIGVVADLSNSKIEEAIIAQNKSHLEDVSEGDKQVKVIRRIKGRTPLLNNVVIETSATLWQRLQEQKLRVGFQVVAAVDQSPLVQCYNCLGFGHKANECKNETTCGHCGDNHETRNCGARDEAPRCANCSSQKHSAVDHPAFSSLCPEWTRWDRIARSAVQYC